MEVENVQVYGNKCTGVWKYQCMQGTWKYGSCRSTCTQQYMQ